MKYPPERKAANVTEFDPHPPFQDYAHPGRLVSAPWLSARLGIKGLRVIEVDEDSLLYDIGHIPTATRINFHTELLDQNTRDVVDSAGFAALMRAKGIKRDDTIVIYGDKSNWWAAFALWIFELYGHEDVRLLDGGRDAWMAEERDTSFMVPDYAPTDYPVVERDDVPLRAFVDEVRAASTDAAVTLVDVRTPAEYAGTGSNPAVLRGGHVPSAVNLPWDSAVHANSRFRSRTDLAGIYGDLDPKV